VILTQRGRGGKGKRTYFVYCYKFINSRPDHNFIYCNR
jgi:hypothetical protein